MVAIGCSSMVVSASCGGETIASDTTDDGKDSGWDAGVSNDSGTEAETPDGGADVTADADLPSIPVPDGGYPHCVGESTQYTGPCCEGVHCYTPSGSSCPSAAQVSLGDLGVHAPGSGTCECGRAGPFNSAGAEQWTDEAGACCYVIGVQSCMGRPLKVGGHARLAGIVSGDGWSGEIELLEVRDLDSHVRSRLAEEWARDAQHEHASIASFNRFSLHLLALGAPARMVEAAQRAALDEVRHAEACLALASAYAGRALAPGKLSLAGDVLGDTDLVRLAVETVEEGCVGETLASLEASTALGEARDVAVSRTLALIADDEARHAELAWTFVRWAIREGGEPVRRAVSDAFERALRAAPAADGSRHDDDSLSRYGQLSEQDRARVLRDGLQRVVAPAYRALVS